MKLEDRVARIERLLAQQADFSSASCTAARESVWKVDTNAMEPTLETRLANFVAPDFWISLSEDTNGLRETLENTQDKAEEEWQANAAVLNHPKHDAQYRCLSVSVCQPRFDYRFSTHTFRQSK